MSNQISIFCGGKMVAKGISKEPINIPVMPAQDNNSVNKTITGHGTVTIDAKDEKWYKDMMQSFYFDRKQVKQMFYAVTHGQVVIFDVKAEMKDGSINDGEIVCSKPRQLREFFNLTKHIRCPYNVTSKPT